MSKVNWRFSEESHDIEWQNEQTKFIVKKCTWINVFQADLFSDMFSVIMLLSDVREYLLSVAWQSKWQIDYEKLLKKETRKRKYHAASM